METFAVGYNDHGYNDHGYNDHGYNDHGYKDHGLTSWRPKWIEKYWFFGHEWHVITLICISSVFVPKYWYNDHT